MNGFEYKLSRHEGINRISEFNELTIYPNDKKAVYYTRRAAPNSRLATSSNPKEIAEFQWRLSTGLSPLLLALLGIPLSRATPRQGKYAKIFVGRHHLRDLLQSWSGRNHLGRTRHRQSGLSWHLVGQRIVGNDLVNHRLATDMDHPLTQILSFSARPNRILFHFS